MRGEEFERRERAERESRERERAYAGRQKVPGIVRVLCVSAQPQWGQCEVI